MTTSTLAPDLLQKMNAYWRAASYVSVGQIYLYDNPLLRRPLQLSGSPHRSRALLAVIFVNPPRLSCVATLLSTGEIDGPVYSRQVCPAQRARSRSCARPLNALGRPPLSRDASMRSQIPARRSIK
jgi:hypothetical protein